MMGLRSILKITTPKRPSLSVGTSTTQNLAIHLFLLVRAFVLDHFKIPAGILNKFLFPEWDSHSTFPTSSVMPQFRGWADRGFVYFIVTLGSVLLSRCSLWSALEKSRHQNTEETIAYNTANRKAAFSGNHMINSRAE